MESVVAHYTTHGGILFLYRAIDAEYTNLFEDSGRQATAMLYDIDYAPYEFPSAFHKFSFLSLHCYTHFLDI